MCDKRIKTINVQLETMDKAFIGGLNIPTFLRWKYCQVKLKAGNLCSGNVVFFVTVDIGGKTDTIRAFLAANEEQTVRYPVNDRVFVEVSGFMASSFAFPARGNVELTLLEEGSCEEGPFLERGIDVSSSQGDIDWRRVGGSGVKRVFMKMTEGVTTDQKFAQNWSEARESGVKIGAYHYFRALDSTPKAQCKNIIENLTAIQFDPKLHWLAINVGPEFNQAATPMQMADNLHELLSLLANEPLLENIAPMIYCSPAYWDRAVEWSKYDFSVYPLWVAFQTTGALPPRIPISWLNSAGRDWIGWQYNPRGIIDGIQGNVDVSWFRES